MDLVITHQGQCPHQVSLNLADPHFQGLTCFLSQGLLKLLAFNSEFSRQLVLTLKANVTPKKHIIFANLELFLGTHKV